MGVPKRKTSKMRLRTRKAANRWHAAAAEQVPAMRQHGSVRTRACPSCGYYKGRQVLTIEGK